MLRRLCWQLIVELELYHLGHQYQKNALHVLRALDMPCFLSKEEDVLKILTSLHLLLFLPVSLVTWKKQSQRRLPTPHIALTVFVVLLKIFLSDTWLIMFWKSFVKKSNKDSIQFQNWLIIGIISFSSYSF